VITNIGVRASGLAPHIQSTLAHIIGLRISVLHMACLQEVNFTSRKTADGISKCLDGYLDIHNELIWDSTIAEMVENL
jgi:hypothetical protein